MLDISLTEKARANAGFENTKHGFRYAIFANGIGALSFPNGFSEGLVFLAIPDRFYRVVKNVPHDRLRL